MNIKEELTHETLIQQVSKKLLAARQEIDEFVVQLALGKAEGKEKFELLKREFSTRLQEWKKSFSTDAMENELKEKITALETQLEQAKAEEVRSRKFCRPSFL